jgi:hypothetical protein
MRRIAGFRLSHKGVIRGCTPAAGTRDRRTAASHGFRTATPHPLRLFNLSRSRHQSGRAERAIVSSGSSIAMRAACSSLNSAPSASKRSNAASGNACRNSSSN